MFSLETLFFAAFVNVASRDPLAAPVPVPHDPGLRLAGAGRRGGQARAQRAETVSRFERLFGLQVGERQVGA
jgi:hypothetical protein